MSTATELLRRADEICSRVWDPKAEELSEEIRAYLAAEPEAEYDFYGVIPLTHRKAKGIIKDKGYHVTGFVLSRPDGDKCIVDMSAVRWLTGKEFFEMMHPPVVSPTAEPEAKPVAWIQPNHLDKAQFMPFLCRVEPKQRDDFIPLYTRPEPAIRKPMTEEEIDVGFNPYRMRWLADDQYFVAGIRFAEKHHGIGGDDA